MKNNNHEPKILTFRTETQAALFENELRGQISDGAWENLGRRGHWQPWCDAEIGVGERVGRNFHAPYTGYNFARRDLLEVVGRRMLSYCRLAIRFGRENVETLDGFLDLDGRFAGLPTYPGDYWIKKRAEMTAKVAELGITHESIEDAVNDETLYSQRDLRADLREIKKAIKERSDI